ncbi:methionyl-tRNA formyltransferase [Candidatus Nomurabacteria bacterium]|nr:methionyl-tRNA formyltransferase [Candidatus Nomurabacteria bacterium]
MAIKTLYLGSNWEALETLKSLDRDSRFDISAIITQPDKPKGRDQKVIESEIKLYAQEHDIPVFYTRNKEERYSEALDLFKPDLIVCKSFGEIIPGDFLEAPKFKAINIHFSLLPKYRGAVPIQKAILDGETETGISIVKMVAELDAGPILAQFRESIKTDDTNETLRKRLVKRCTDVIGDTLEKWIQGQIKPEEQDDKSATYCWKADISKEKAEINWQEKSAEEIERMVRAFLPWPVAWTAFREKRLKIFKAQLVDNSTMQVNLAPGQFTSQSERLFIGTNSSDKLIQPIEVQLEGKTVMSASEFIRGQEF